MAHGKQLCSGDVHLWWTRLSAGVTVRESLVAQVLSRDERERAVRFHFARDRYRFVLGRGMLRQVLALYVDVRPEEITFRYLSHGKPRLEDSGLELEFNVAHSDELALCAVSREPVGVDVEHLVPLDKMDQLATMAFSRTEQQALFALEPDRRLLGFFNCWTRKEAYAKARGDGLAMPFDAFDVSLKPGEPARLLANRLDPNEVACWSLATISPADGYVGAIATRGQGPRMCLRQWYW